MPGDILGKMRESLLVCLQYSRLWPQVAASAMRGTQITLKRKSGTHCGPCGASSDEGGKKEAGAAPEPPGKLLRRKEIVPYMGTSSKHLRQC